AVGQLGVDPRAPVALPTLSMDRRDGQPQSFVRLLARGGRARPPRVEASPRDLERPAQQPHGERGLLRGDEREPHGFSFAKKAVAFFKMSRSMRSVRFSRRRRPSSSRSSLVSAPGPPRPPSISPSPTHPPRALSLP